MSCGNRRLEERGGAFQALPRARPICFHGERQLGPLAKGPGYWALARHTHILEVGRTPAVFCSRRGSMTSALVDAELGGQKIRAGEKVVMFYSSGNRDAPADENAQRSKRTLRW